MDYRHVMETDPELFKAIADEVERQREHIELIASENFVSPAVMEAMGSPLTNKYAEGYPAKRYYGGCQYVDVAENLARDRAKLLFGAEHANVQPHSGAQANTAVYFAMLNPGDTVLGMNLSHGGHLTHGSPVNISGKYFHFIPYGVDEATGRIDYDAVRTLALENKPRMIVAGASAYPRAIDFARLREIADEAGALLMVDMAHIAGLVAAGMHQSPVPYADFVTTTTHKTLRGPRGGGGRRAGRPAVRTLSHAAGGSAGRMESPVSVNGSRARGKEENVWTEKSWSPLRCSRLTLPAWARKRAAWKRPVRTSCIST